jgi:MoxR-like ATPase
VVGQDEVIDQMLVGALTGSHALLVGVPGLA